MWLLLVAFSASAQTSGLALGSWQVHVPNNRAVAVAETPTSVYTATQNGLFRYLKEDNALQVLSRNDGFSDVGIKTLRYDSASASLLIAYENTNLDLLRDGTVTNLTELLRKSMPGVKTIYHLNTHNKRAYLATSFGLVVLDLVKKDVKDTYSNLGPQGEPVQVYSSTVLGDSLYIASSRGMMAAHLANPNLLDFKSWRRFGPADGLSNTNNPDSYKTLATFNNDVFLGINGVGIYRFTGSTWVPAAFNLNNPTFKAMETNGRRLVVTGPSEILEVNLQGQAARQTDPLLQNLSMAIPTANGGQWVASLDNGLVRVKGNVVEAFTPNGPAFADVFSIYAEADRYTVLAGGFDLGYLQRGSLAGFYQYQNGQWTSYSKNSGGQFPTHVMDLVDAIRNPVTGKFYIASYGGGLLEWDGLDKVILYNENNSPLLSAIPGNQDFVRITSLAVDETGSLWVVNRNQLLNAPGLFELKPDYTWVPHRLNYLPGSIASTNFDKIVLDEYGYKWLSMSANYNPAGIVVYDNEKKTHKYLGLSQGLPNAQVYSMALDQSGEMWIGTGNGVGVFSTSSDVFSTSFPNAYVPIYERRPLLEGQIIRSIAIDGGNRKWIGTDTGLWLFSETGEELVHSFTTRNSPLPSNKIIDIAINPANGEVIIGTEAGLAVFRGTGSVTGKVNENCLQVFPNPVRPGFTGSVGITGLPNNGWVKITDMAGMLVFEGKANGGTFAWNTRDYNGRRASPGVYLVFATNQDGSETCTAKIAVQ